MRRQLLGTASSLMTRVRVYLSADAVEVDEIEGYTGTRRRVLLDEVLLITLDRRHRWLVVLFWASLGAVLSLPGAVFSLSMNNPDGLVISAFMGAPFFLVALVHLAAGADYVTAFGKRSTAQVAFTLRKGRARGTFALLRERVEQAQEAARARGPAPAAGGGSSSVLQTGDAS